MKRYNLAQYKKIISEFDKAKVLVIGDLILDEYIWGKVERISPEAPIPVVWVDSESFMPGGASNVANNIVALGGKAWACGVIGRDQKGGILRDELKAKGINIDGVFVDEHRPTTVKTRILAHQQQVVRVDRENIEVVNEKLLKEIFDFANFIIDEVDIVIIEDYGKGLIQPYLLKKILGIAKRKGKFVTVDPKQDHFSYYKGITAITPNFKEAQLAANLPLTKKGDLYETGKKLLKRLGCKAVLVTLGEEGMCLFESSGKITKIPTVAKEVFDVSGAGDTVISVFSLALASGASMRLASIISNFAAGIVVGKLGVAVVNREELLNSIKESIGG